jgi:hypothetical protein
MKELRIIKLVEQTEVKFIADDGSEFTTETACKDYEKRTRCDEITREFERLTHHFINTSLLDFYYYSECDIISVTLYDKRDYNTLMDYLIYVRRVWDKQCIPEPTAYPYNTLIQTWDDNAYDMGSPESLIDNMNRFIESVRGGDTN